MPLVDDLRQKIETDRFEFSKHAVDQSILRRINVQEVHEAIANGESFKTHGAQNQEGFVDICSAFVGYTKASATVGSIPQGRT